jgi:hypothetical protein
VVQQQRKNKGPGCQGRRCSTGWVWQLEEAGLATGVKCFPVFLFSGSDGCIQVVRLKTSVGELITPVQHVFPLVISQQEPQLFGHDVKNPPLVTSDLELKPVADD